MRKYFINCRELMAGFFEDCREALKEYFKDCREALLARPVCIAALVLIAAVYISGELFGIQNGNNGYMAGAAKNPMSERGIDDGDTCTWFGRVRDIRSNNLNQQISYTITLTNVSYTDNTEKIPLTNFTQTVLLYTDDVEGVKLGSIVKITGDLSYFEVASNEGEFDKYRFYSNRGCLFCIKHACIVEESYSYSHVRQTMYMVKLSLERRISEMFEDENAAILKAMLLGIREDIDADVKESFQKSGVAHILAISGLHISFLCMTLYNLMMHMRIPNLINTGICSIFLILYVVMVGFSASSFRAAGMFVFFLVSKQVKRSYDMMTAMSACAVILLVINPGYLYDTAFLLSFCAVFGVGFFANMDMKNSPGLKAICKMRSQETVKGRLYNLIIGKSVSGLVSSVWVYLVTLPVILMCYYETAPYSILLNMVIIPLMSVLLVCALIGIILYGNINIIADVFVTIVKSILYFYKSTCTYLEAGGLGRRNIGMPKAWAVILFYAILLVIVLYKGKNRQILKICGFITCVIILCNHGMPQNRLYFLDVGQGDSIVWRGENGHTYIFDSGSTSVKEVGKKRIIPFLKYYGVNEVEGVFLSHADMDHISGIYEILDNEITERIHIKNIYVYETALSKGDYEKLEDWAAARNCSVVGIGRGDVLEDGKLRIECLYPDKGFHSDNANNMSLVLKISYGEFDFLETGDLEEEGERSIVREYGSDRLRTDILKVGHHGSGSSSSEEFLKHIRCDSAVISVGSHNSYGHPHKETIERLNKNTHVIYRTDCDGEITVTVKEGGMYEVTKRF